MKIIIAYPPLANSKGYPTLGQNRQFQYFKDTTLIYPVVPASAATLLKVDGFDVVWLDCAARHIDYDEFLSLISLEKPDLIAMEAKTPVVKREWEIIKDISGLKIEGPGVTTVLFGDHVTALPKESMENSRVDFILTGGDYDFLLLNLCRSLRKKINDRSHVVEADLEPGIWYRKGESIFNTGEFKLDHDLNALPFIDRELTEWRSYAYRNGNFRRTPGTYIMSGRDCWWGKCTFCSWPQLYPKFRVRSAENVLNEIEYLVNTLGVKEIMDDTGTFPTGRWLEDFCKGMIKRGLNKKVAIDCNMRFGALERSEYKLMKAAGFRLLLFGIESANQNTLDRLKKNLDINIVADSCRNARKAGLYPHITLMFGYPWESFEDAVRTMEFGRNLLKKDYAYTMQSTIVIPYPQTPLFKECMENSWLLSMDWSDFDMKNPVMKLGFPAEKVPELVQTMYSVSFSPEFIFRKILSIKNADDIGYFVRAFFKVIGHILDFKNQNKRPGKTC